MKRASQFAQRIQITHLFAVIIGAVAMTASIAPTLGSVRFERFRFSDQLEGQVFSGESAQPDKKTALPDSRPAPLTREPERDAGKTQPDAARTPAIVNRPTSFLLNSDKHPHIRISWLCRDATVTTLEADLEYQAPKQSVPIGKNLSAYVALGGTRGDLGLGAPGAVDVRVGFYKLDKSKPMFDSLADDTAITVEFTGISFNQLGVAKPSTTIQHLKFEGNTTVLGCAGDPGVLATYNTLDATQTIGDLITRKNGRLGALSQKTGSVQASVSFTAEKDGSVGMKAVVPYALFKHADDPWLRGNPGEFTEPVHFHIEFECEPVAKPTQEIKETPKQAK